MMEEGETGPEHQADGLEHIPPISEIRDFELPADVGLRDRVRRSIDRREAASGGEISAGLPALLGSWRRFSGR